MNDSEDVTMRRCVSSFHSVQWKEHRLHFSMDPMEGAAPEVKNLSFTSDSKMLFIVKLGCTSKLFPADIPSVAEGTLHPTDAIGPLGKVSQLQVPKIQPAPNFWIILKYHPQLHLRDVPLFCHRPKSCIF